MIRVTAILVLAAAVVLSQDDTVLRGSVKDCSQTTVHPIPNVTVRTFDVATNRQMLNVLLAIDSIGSPLDDPTVPDRMESLYRQLVGFLGSATPLAIDTSNSSGDFTVRFAPTDSVFVVGFGVMEDQAYYFSYKVLGGRTSTTFVLDMSRGNCGLAAAQALAHSQTVCRNSDETSANLIQQIASMLTPGDSLRISLGVPVVPSSQVTLVADPTQCSRALQVQDSVIAASNRSYLPPYPSRSLYVIRVGTYYASLDTNGNTAHWKSVYFWDTNWRFLGFFFY